MYGPAFYSNICKLLSTLHGGIKHQRPTVKLPLSKVGLELSRVLTNLGIIDDFTVGQRLGRVPAHSPLWDPARTHISATRDAAGYAAMYLTLHLNYDKHKPIWYRAPLAAAPHVPSQHTFFSSSSSSGGAVALPDPQHFTPPMGVNSPTPESVKLMSKPSVQRWMGVRDILAARRNMRPGIFLLSTTQGLLTDIDCELRGLGGTVLAHLGLPLAHVIQLRGLLRHKHHQELQSALPEGAPAAARLDRRAQRALDEAGKVARVPLDEWDGRAASARGLAERVRQQVGAAAALCDDIAADMAARQAAAREAVRYGRADLLDPDQLPLQADRLLAQLELQQAAWEQGGNRLGAASSSSSSVGDGGRDGGSGREGRRGRGGGGSDRYRSDAAGSADGRGRSGGERGSRGRGRQGLFDSRPQRQQQQEGGVGGGFARSDSWQPPQ